MLDPGFCIGACEAWVTPIVVGVLDEARAQTTGRCGALPWVAMVSEQIFDDHETIASRCSALSPAALRAWEAGR